MEYNDLNQHPEDRFPDIDSELESDQKRREQLLLKLIAGQTIAVFFLMVMITAGGLLLPQSGLLNLLLLGVIAVSVGVVSGWLLRRGQFRGGGYIFLLGTSVAITANVFLRGYQDVSGIFYLWPILGAVMLLEARGSLVVATASVTFYSILVVIQRLGYQTPLLPYDPLREELLTVGARVMMFFLLAFLAWLSNQHDFNRPLQSARRTARRWRELNKTLKQHASELEKLNRQLLVLQSAGAAITSSLAWQDVLKAITREMARLLEVEGCAIFEWNQAADTVSLLAEHGLKDWWNEDSLKKLFSLADYPLIKRVLTEKRVQQMVIGLLDADSAELAYMRRANVTSLLALPMVFQNRVVGLVEIMNRARRSFSDQEISLAQLLANQAVIALENARLFEQAQQEITERKRAEEQIKTSLQEKEVLLKEIHHRVKNNLQIISSLFHLQSDYVEDEQALEILQDSQNRVRSMVLIHEKLYQSDNLAQIYLANYILDLSAYLFRAHKAAARGITLKTHVDDVFLKIDTAIPCGLILNELVSNALKHAFPQGQKGEILIEFRTAQERQLTLLVSDNGIGLPPDMDFRETTSLGLQLVNTLVDQLGGTITLDRSGGTRFEITFTRPPFTRPPSQNHNKAKEDRP